jgi:hypothetical protein
MVKLVTFGHGEGRGAGGPRNPGRGDILLGLVERGGGV